MALLADGWHMSSHALALGVSAGAYVFARHAHDPRFAFGTWKIEVLGGYTSAVLLVVVAAFMGFESVRASPTRCRSTSTTPSWSRARPAVNVVCAWWLPRAHDHGIARAPSRRTGTTITAPSPRPQPEVGLPARRGRRRTSVLAIVALFSGKLWGASWLDPVMGIVGAVLVSVWAYGLLRDTSRILVDAEMNAPIVDEMRDVVSDAPQPTIARDLHVWRVAKGKYACT